MVADTHESNRWISYFSKNRESLMPIPWENSYRLTPEEARVIARSLAQFQLGENSDGHRLLQLAERATHNEDTALVPALRLFIQEEQRHAGWLGQFMQREGLRMAKTHWVDTVFRLLRRGANLEMAVVAMLTAEIIAVPFYGALYRATASPVLRQICRQLLRDEVQHLRFQIHMLNKLRLGRGSLRMNLTYALQRLLLSGTLLIVWQQHHAVLVAGGFSFSGFWRAGWRHYERVHARVRRTQRWERQLEIVR